MAWRDNLRPASYRGAVFYLSQAAGASGRRLAVHEYPQRDEPFAEDMGRSTRRFTLTGYVLGPDYMAARDALIQACEVEGPGPLVHPYRGEIQVSCESVRWTESQEEGGICRFELSFVEGAENRSPAAPVNTRGAVIDAASLSSEASMAGFARLYRWQGLQDFILDTSAGGLRDFAASVAGLQQVAGTVSDGGFVTSLDDAARTIFGQADDIARSDGIPGQIGNALSLLRRVHADAATAMRGLATLRDFVVSSPEPIYLTSNREIEARNATGLANLVRELAVTEQARASANRTFASYQEAIAVRDGLVGDLETVLVAAGNRGDDDAYRAVTGLQTAVTRDLTERGASLAHIVHPVVPSALPSLVAAHRFHVNVDREAEVIARNPGPHPAWMRERLEVLSR